MDPARHKVGWDGRDVVLTVTEFMILETLAQRPGVVKTRNQLLDIAYHEDVYVDDRTIDSHIKRIRRKFRVVDPEFDGDRDAVRRRLQVQRPMKRAKPHEWSGKWSLTHRILAVNILTVIIVALGIVYLDAFRNRLSKERLRLTEREAQLSAVALANAPAERRAAALGAIGRATDSRIRLYDAGGRLVADSWSITGPHLPPPRPGGRTVEKGFRPSARQGI